MKETLKALFSWLYQKRQIIIQALVLLSAALYFVYALGYTSNWAGVVTETRGANFFNASQQANRLMVNIGFITVIIILINLANGSFKRNKYYLSNFLLSIVTAVLLIVQAVMTIYYNGVLRRMYERITEEEIPAYLYATHGAGEKSYAVFEQGNILSYILIVISILLFLFIIQKANQQKERAKLIKELLINEH